MLKRKENNKAKSNKTKTSKGQLIIVGSLLIALGVGIVGGKLVYNYILNKQEDVKIEEFFEQQEEIENTDESEIEEVKDTEQKTVSCKPQNYIAVIKIPKIGLEKGLYSKESSSNNVNKNIQILKEADMPDVESGNFILASHSGNGRISYFRNLYKLNADDEISIFYNGFEYKYKVVNIYDVEKTGTANIVRNAEKNTLTLITCRHNTNKQIVVICELIEKI